MHYNSIICCGSKAYNNIDLSNIVDIFNIIVRHNMLINTTIYGKNPSTFQILNTHVYCHYRDKASRDTWISKYSKFGAHEKTIKNFYDYINNNTTTTFLYYDNNNQDKLVKILKQSNFNLSLDKMPRCGLGHIAEVVSNGTKPFLIGYSLCEDENKRHQQNKIVVDLVHHSPEMEQNIIIHLHNKGLIDATFCCINDTKNISLNNKLQHTEQSLNILRKIYGNIRFDQENGLQTN